MLIKKKRPITHQVVVSDLHCGCRVGLCPPVIELDDGGSYHHSKYQKIVWNWWEEFWGEWVPHICKGEPFSVVVNGDPMDGNHHGAVTQISHNPVDQKRVALQALKPIVEQCEGRFYMIRGTEAHGGESGNLEENLAEELHAIPNAEGQYARWELWYRLGEALVHLSHHIGTAGSMHYESTALMRELAEAYVEAGRWNNEPPDVVIRSHRHRNAEVRIQTHKGFCTVATTPGWQLKTPFTYKIAGARQTLPQIGGSIVICGPEDIYTRHKVWNLTRPKEESNFVDDHRKIKRSKKCTK